MKISHIFPPLCPYGHTKPYFHNSIKYKLSIYHMMKQVHLNSYTSKPSFSTILNSLFTSSNSILIPPYNTSLTRVVLDEHTVVFTEHTKCNTTRILLCMQCCAFCSVSIHMDKLRCNNISIHILVFLYSRDAMPLSPQVRTKTFLF